MVRIPDRSDVRPRDPQAGPMVSYEGLRQSAYYAGQAVQRAAGQLADVGFDMAERARRRQLEQQEFEAEIGEIQFEDNVNRIWREAAESVEPGAPNFTEKVLAEYDTRARAFVQGLPEPLQPKYDKRLFERRERFKGASLEFEKQEYSRYHDNLMADSLGSLRERAARFPDQMGEYQGRGEEVIGTAPHLSPAERDERKRAWRQRLQRSVLERTIERNPDAALEALGEPRPLGDLGIVDMSDPDFHYGRSATANARPFEGIVFHHAEGDAESIARYGQRVDAERGGAFGYHFVIGEDGQIVQAAPLDKRTNHVKPGQHAARKGARHLSNSNSMGVSLINAHKGGPTEAQVAAVKKLVPALAAQYGISPENIVGHGEVQSDRMEIEGEIARMFRPDERFADIPPDERVDLRRAAMSARSRRQREARAASDKAKADMRRLVASDIASRESTGQPVEGVTGEQVAAILGENAASRYLRDRATADGIYEFTSDIYQLNADELEARLQATRPEPGSSTFEIEEDVHRAVRRAVERQRRLRVQDPALAVDNHPAVQEAKQAGDGEAMVAARMQAQEATGIVPETRQPLTEDEADSLAAGVMAAIVEGAQSGEIFGNGGRRIFRQKMEEMREAYGQFAEAVMAQVVNSGVRNDEHAMAAAAIIRDIATGAPVSRRAAEEFDETKAAEEAGAATTGDPKRAAEFARQGASSPRAEDNPVDGGGSQGRVRGPRDMPMGDRAAGETVGAMVGEMAGRGVDNSPEARMRRRREIINHPQGGTFLANAMARLRARPQLADQFEDVFGEGTAEMVLGGASPAELDQHIRDQITSQ